ncbi:molybdenum containing formylmethanofuran dehydrogenase, subunit B [Methanothermobacter sp. MT-2]|nr:molybdenum containing formylmethanofuran dehydrogenase, subunit B [Methanothermobacter sp. MT-2]HHW05090.1 formylmethanofuran dehydrogenase subunit B [Methanothermobacter sp.]HPU37898.1 formylmethanofuran dehydrogenase subunit B [Methanothermobacter sp.]
MNVYRNITCPVCGASCDDIEVHYDGSNIKTKNACRMGNAKFEELVSPHRIKNPQINENGSFREVEWDEAVERAAKILVDAKKPGIFLGSEISIEAMSVGLELGEYIRGVVDSNATICHGPTIMGMQEAGLSGATAGEVRNRADLIIYWGSNPMDSMPRHLSRYTTFMRGFFRERGRSDRTIVVVDPRETATAKAADMFLQLKPNSDYELFSALLTVLRGKEPHKSIEEVSGIEIEKIKELVQLMKTSQFGVIYGGLGLASSQGKHRNLEMVLKLVAALNEHTKFVIGALRGHCNVAGFNQVASWQYGYPYGLDFTREYPRYNPGETTIVDLLRRREVDALLVICADLAAHLPKECVEYMKEIPVICIDIAPCPTTLVSNVLLPGVIDAMESSGTFYRFDNVPIHHRAFTESPFTFTESNEDTLNQIFEKVKMLKKQD